MFNLFRKNRIIKYTDNAFDYLKHTFIPRENLDTSRKLSKTILKTDTYDGLSVPENATDVNPPIHKTSQTEPSDSGVRYSLKNTDDVHSSRRTAEPSFGEDKYDSEVVSSLMHEYDLSDPAQRLLKSLDQNLNKSFVDELIIYINKKGMRDSEVYKAAQIDRRLFSKIMSNREYKPAKDTAVALAFALKLSLEEASDLLARAGYILSHSNKKDIIIEYFFRENIYNLDDINQVLFNLGQKIIGR